MRRILGVLAVTLLLSSCSSGEQHAPAFRPLVVGDKTPSFAVRTLKGDTARVGDGSLVLLNVWATWCTSCREEMADLAKLDSQYRDRGLRILAVSVDGGNGERVRRFVEAEHLAFTVGLDPAGEVQRTFQAVGVPETYLIGKDGRLLWIQRGGLHGAPNAARGAVDSALAPLR